FHVTGVQTCALPISSRPRSRPRSKNFGARRRTWRRGWTRQGPQCRPSCCPITTFTAGAGAATWWPPWTGTAARAAAWYCRWRCFRGRRSGSGWKTARTAAGSWSGWVVDGHAMEHVIVYTDGASRGNPGPAGAGWLLADAEGRVFEEGWLPLGETTNNVAEYQAVIAALERARQLGARRVTLRSDSELLVQQLSGV